MKLSKCGESKKLKLVKGIYIYIYMSGGELGTNQ